MTVPPETVPPGSFEDRDYRFRFFSGRLSLNLVAAVAERGGRSYDRWRSPRDLDRWCLESGFVADAPGCSQTDLENARALREAVYRTIQARRTRKRPRPKDLALVNAWAARPPLAPSLGADGGTLSWHAERPLEALLASAARDCIDLLAGDDLAKIKECEEETCSVLFVDSSRPGKRRWCSMSICGNRVKKAAYRARQEAS